MGFDADRHAPPNPWMQAAYKKPIARPLQDFASAPVEPGFADLTIKSPFAPSPYAKAPMTPLEARINKLEQADRMLETHLMTLQMQANMPPMLQQSAPLLPSASTKHTGVRFNANRTVSA